MIRIFNKKLNVEILIDDKVEWVQFNPRHYEDKPYVIIEFKKFSFPRHAKKCSDCKQFLEAFGKDSVDWYISYFDKLFRLNTKEVGKDGHPSNKVIDIPMSDYNPGSRLTLVFHELPTDKSELKSLLEKILSIENFEKACLLRDLIKEE
jgi:hypothetical protein